MTSVESYPFLTRDEFKEVCGAFCSSVAAKELGSTGWESIRLRPKGEVYFLRILRQVKTQQASESTDLAPLVENDAAEIEDDADEEALRPSNTELPGCIVEYDIVLSPSYCVPVVYFTIYDEHGSMITDINAMYETIVPPAYRDHLRSFGVMGGISMTNHPYFDVPSFFVHPCQTAEALENAAGEQEILIQNYLQLWLGIIGNSVGLQAPMPATAQKDECVAKME